jgi:hypothetical protein
MTQTMNKVSISHISNMHNQWLRSLNFYKTELGILKGLLTEIAGKNTGSEATKEVEHFENQFKVQTNNIDMLCHEIHVNIDAISKAAQHASAGYVDGKLLTDHTALGNKADDLEKIVTELVHSFRKFAQKWM